MKALNVIRVAAISSKPLPGLLSYFSLNSSYKRGDLVIADINGSKTACLVLACSEGKLDKSSIRLSSFTLKRLRTYEIVGSIEVSLVDKLELLSKSSLRNVGSVVNEIVSIKKPISPYFSGSRHTEISILQAARGERLMFYRRLISESVEANEHILFVTPGKTQAQLLTKELSMSEPFDKELCRVITPKNFLNELGKAKTLIVDDEGGSYRSLGGQSIDKLACMLELANSYVKRLYLADDFVSIETKAKYPRAERIKTATSNVKTELADLRKSVSSGRRLVSLTSTLDKLVSESVANKCPILLISARRDLFPIIVCADCGTHLGNQKNLPHKTTCPHCGSWRLTPLSLGADTVAEEIKTKYPDIEVRLVSGNSSALPSRELSRLTLPEGQLVLIITEALLPFVNSRFKSVAVVHIDNLLNFPGYKMKERLFRNLLKARRLATKSFLIQTRDTNNALFKFVLENSIEEFEKDELRVRARFGYPPSVTLIKLTGDVSSVRLKFAKWQPLIVSPACAIIRVPSKLWPNKELLVALNALSPKTKKEVNPETIL